MDNQPLAPLRQDPAPLRNQIIFSIRSAIESGRLRPGDRLVERELCEQLNVSRTSLREALRELHSLGVLASDNRGLAVAVLTPEEANNIYAVRGVVESLVAGQFVEKATAIEVAKLVALAATLKAAYKAGDVQEIIQTKRSFYDELCHGARNSVALDIIGRLTLRTSSLRSQSLARSARQAQSIKEIDAIVAAIKKGDREEAAAAAFAHVSHAASSALDEAGLSSLATEGPTLLSA